MENCHGCGEPFVRVAWQIKKSDFFCISCRRRRAKGWRDARKAAGVPVIGAKMPREWHQQYEKKYTAKPEVRTRRAKQMRAYAKAPETREHHIARWKVQRALKTGRLTKHPCEVCGSLRVQAHHDDYSKPLEVRWLCRTHHDELHAKATGGA